MICYIKINNQYIITRIYFYYLQIKLLNTASNMDNFSVIVTTVDLGCYHKDFHVYGHQDVEANKGGTFYNKNLHFTGRFSKFELVDSETISGYIRCVFKPVLNVVSPYVFVALKRIPEAETWRICEVEFA